MEINQIKEILLEKIHNKTGWFLLRLNCECEDLYIQNINEESDGKQIIEFKYIFDEDGWSQYDKTHVFKGYITLEKENIISFEMEIMHVGVAAVAKYSPKT